MGLPGHHYQLLRERLSSSLCLPTHLDAGGYELVRFDVSGVRSVQSMNARDVEVKGRSGRSKMPRA